jgi:hypothetical protein
LLKKALHFTAAFATFDEHYFFGLLPACVNGFMKWWGG